MTTRFLREKADEQLITIGATLRRLVDEEQPCSP